MGDNRILIAGGRDDSNNYLDQVGLIDLQTKSYSLSPQSLKAKRGYFRTAIIMGKIYAVGGWNGSASISTIEEAASNTANPIWTTSTKSLQIEKHGYTMTEVPL